MLLESKFKEIRTYVLFAKKIAKILYWYRYWIGIKLIYQSPGTTNHDFKKIGSIALKNSLILAKHLMVSHNVSSNRSD
jgi:hypothetical protein